MWDFPGGALVKAPRSHCRAHRFERNTSSIPGWGTKILYVAWPETHVDFMCQLDQITEYPFSQTW